jgi:hypothetical protein
MSTAIAIESSWTPQATEVLARAYDYYGGVDTWRALRCIRLVPTRLSGLLPWVKGVGKTFPLPTLFEVSPHQHRTRFVGFPDAEHVGIFDNGAVRIERSSDSSVVTRSENHRSTFAWPANARRWAPLDALYFFGYALAHYHSLPFSLSLGRLLRVTTSGTKLDRIDVLDVELPADLHTHSRRQRFHFDRLGRLVRHDYHAEVVGFFARAAHHWNRQTRFNGLPVSLERHVVGRLASTAVPVTALLATFADVEVELDRAPAAVP